MAVMSLPMPAKGRTATALDRYLDAGRLAGCPADQMQNLIRVGAVLQPRQLEASAASRLCDRAGGPTRVGYGGARGGGKSHWAAVQIGADDCQRQPELKVLFLRKVLKYARESFNDLRRAAYRNLPHKYNENSGRVEFPNGSQIVLGHYKNESDIDNYLGLQYDVIAIEEANTLTAKKKRDIYTCLRTSKPNWRPRGYETTNPGGVGHADFKRQFIEPWRRQQQDETRFIGATVDDNRFVNREYKAELEKLTGWQLRAWRYGDWDIAAGQYFSNFTRDVHVVTPFRVPDNWTAWIALDYGFTHYTAAYVFTKDNDGNIYCIGEHAERQWVVKRHAEAIKQLAWRTLGMWERVGFAVAGADIFGKRGAERTIAEQYADEGIVFDRANDDRISGATTILNDFGDLERGIRPKLFIFDTCARLAECIPAMQHDPHRPEDVLKVDTDDDGNGGDDFYDAFRYGRMAGERAGGAIAMSYVR